MKMIKISSFIKLQQMKFSCVCVDACTNIYFFGEICHTLLNLLNVTFHNHNLKCLQVWNIFCCDVNTPLYMQTTNKVAHEKMAYVVMVDFICIFASVFVVCQENTLDWKLLVNAEQHQKSLPNYLVVVFFFNTKITFNLKNKHYYFLSC